MSNLIERYMHLTKTNLKKLGDAISKGTDAIVQFAHKHLTGNTPLLLLKSHMNKIMTASKAGKGIRLNFKHKHLMKMTKHGGFLQAILPFLAETVLPMLTNTVLPALATGALTGIGSWGVNKVIDAADKGKGLYNFGQTGGSCSMGSGSKTLKKKHSGMGLYRFQKIPPE